MKYALKSFLVLALMAIIAVPAMADDAPKKKKKPKADARAGRGGGRQLAAIMKKLKEVDLTDEQKTKIKGIAAEYGPKLREAQAAVGKALGGKEAGKKRAAARKKGLADGLKGKELQAAVNDALGLSAEQLEAAKKAQAGAREVQQGFVAAVREVLTDEQIEKAGLRKARKKKGGAKRRAKKGGAKPPANPKSDSVDKKID